MKYGEINKLYTRIENLGKSSQKRNIIFVAIKKEFKLPATIQSLLRMAQKTNLTSHKGEAEVEKTKP
jgi:hypothetical protein